MHKIDHSKEEPLVILVNTEYENEATLDESIDDDIESFGVVTWRQLIEDFQGEDISSHEEDLDEWLEGEYGIASNQLDNLLDDKAIEKYYSSLEFHQNNFSGGNAELFDLIRSLDLFEMDCDGNGSANGVELNQSMADMPRKSVWIAGQEAADWLIQQAAKRGVSLDVIFT